MVIKVLVAGLVVVAFLGLGGLDKLKDLLKASGASDALTNIFSFPEASAERPSENQIETQERVGSIIETINQQGGTQTKSSDISSETQFSSQTRSSDSQDLVSVMFGNEIFRVPRDQVGNISPAAEQLQEQKRFVADQLARGVTFTKAEQEQIARFDARKGTSKKKFSGVEAILLSRREAEKSKQTLIKSGATFAVQKGQEKLFGKENFEFGGISQAEFQKRQAAEIARQNEVSKVTGLTRSQSNALGAANRAIQQSIASSITGFDSEKAIAALRAKGINVHGGLTKEQLATIIRATGVTI